MKVRKLFSAIAITLSLSAIASLFLPIYSTNITDGEACSLVLKGYNLVEFSPWGGVVVLAPLVLIGLMLSKLNDTVKMVCLLGLFILNGVALCGSTSAAYKWICEVSTGFVEPNMNHLIYALLFLVATVCFYIINNVCWGDCSNAVDDQFEKEKFAKKQPNVEPVDYQKETFYLCNRPYRFAKYDEDANITEGQSYLCIVTDEGYFVGFNDDDEAKYFCIEVLDDEEAIGFVEGEMPTGIYGSFYEDYDFRRDTEIDILPFERIESDMSMVWILDGDDEDGAVGRVVDVQVVANTIQDIRVKILDESNENILGCAVMQGLSLLGFVTEYDAENGEYKCISAEMMAIDLCRKIYEHRVYLDMKQRELNKQ